MKTYKERLEAGLLALGWHAVETASGKYSAFAKDIRTPILYIGNAGALRAGACASQSHSIGDPSRQTAFYVKVLAAGDQALAALPQAMGTSNIKNTLKEFVV